MPLIPAYPRCPNCDGELPIERLYRDAPNWRGVVLQGDGSLWGGMATAGNTGIVCPACHSRLLVLQGRVFLAHMSIFCAGLIILLISSQILRGIFPRSFDVRYSWVISVFLSLAWYAWVTIVMRYQQRFVQLRPLEQAEHAAFPLGEDARSN